MMQSLACLDNCFSSAVAIAAASAVCLLPKQAKISLEYLSNSFWVSYGVNLSPGTRGGGRKIGHVKVQNRVAHVLYQADSWHTAPLGVEHLCHCMQIRARISLRFERWEDLV